MLTQAVQIPASWLAAATRTALGLADWLGYKDLAP